MPKPWSQHRRPGNRRFPPRTRNLILKRDHRICQLGYLGCTEVALEADHIVAYNAAVAMGWTRAQFDHPSNGQAVCASCHRLKTASEAAQGRKLAQKRSQKATRRANHPGIVEEPPEGRIGPQKPIRAEIGLRRPKSANFDSQSLQTPNKPQIGPK